MTEFGRQMYSFNHAENTAADEEIYDGDLPTVKNSIASDFTDNKALPGAVPTEVKEVSDTEKKPADIPPKKETGSHAGSASRGPKAKPADKRKSDSTPEPAPTEKRSVGRPKKEGPQIERRQVPFYFNAADHENFQILCIRLKQHMTDFGVALILDAMDNSFRCRSAACGCEFIVRTNSENKPKCPICGNERLDRMYQW